MKNGQKLKLGDAHASSQEISKKYKRQNLGMPPRHPFFIGKNQVTFQDTIFLLLHALCVFLGASVALVSSISFVLFAAINVGSHHVVLEGDELHFSFAKNTPFFTPIVSTSVLFFCYWV
jgi:hypothetical protein